MPKFTKEEFDYSCVLFRGAIKEVNDNLCACRQRLEKIAEMLHTFEMIVILSDYLDEARADDEQLLDLVAGFLEAAIKQKAEQKERERTQKGENPTPAEDIDSKDWKTRKPN